ncbi:MAG: NAD(P)-dependent alcohol dehydrogenase [Cohaesibacter sp.]|jgi:NADPH:quinone reductase-like Zn-dependent oxidoreductase|nr:NAD(P)-dependent alcohol dehydrogenase [Cohaesibacter sp.]
MSANSTDQNSQTQSASSLSALSQEGTSKEQREDMRDYWALDEGFGLANLVRKSAPLPQPKRGEVRLRIDAASYNYRDLVVLAGQHGRAVIPPVIPLSDGVGHIDAVGPDVTDLVPGDRVCPAFFQNWIGGEPPANIHAGSLGGALDGLLASHGVFSAQGLVKIPDWLSDAEAASLPCAGVTAYSALTHPFPMIAGEDVLILGTGGVALFGLQFAKVMGLRVFMITSSDEKAARLRELGADIILNRNRTPDWEKEILRLTGGRGVDRVLELAGAATLGKSLKSVKTGGTIMLIGNVTGSKAELFLPLILTRRLSLHAATVGSKQAFEAMIRLIGRFQIRPIVDRIFAFEEAAKGYEALEAGTHFGNLCISCHADSASSYKETDDANDS